MNKEVSFELAKLLKEKRFNGKYKKAYMYRHEGHKMNSYKGILVDAPLHCDISAPTIAEVVMWLYKKHGIWIEVKSPDYSKELWSFAIHKPYKFGSYGDGTGYNSPTEAYEAAIKHILIRLL